MTFELIRMGWPNTAAIVALAAMPILALTVAADRRPETIQVQQVEPAAICQTPALCEFIVAAAASDVLE